MVGVRVSLKLEASWEFFFAKDRTAPEANCFNSDDYSQLGATRLVGYLSSHIQRALGE